MDIRLDEYTYYIRPGFTDMRQGAYGLSRIVQNQMKLNPFNKAVFMFCGRSKRILKALVWDKNGWIEITKRLECKEMYFWPKEGEEAKQISIEDLKGLLLGHNVFTYLPALKVEKVY